MVGAAFIIYGLAFANNHVCSLSDWETDKYCTLGTSGCCSVPTISKVALAFGVVSSLAAFAGGNCNPRHLTLLHSLGAAISFTCICFYTVLLTALTGKCALTGYEKILFPLRIVLSVLQSILRTSSSFAVLPHTALAVLHS
ncbi:hypothetical protein INR49_021761 [Caranx melampygus]|nr:hypothetical protein INR49_021761 [Caranx melampygus]